MSEVSFVITASSKAKSITSDHRTGKTRLALCLFVSIAMTKFPIYRQFLFMEFYLDTRLKLCVHVRGYCRSFMCAILEAKWFSVTFHQCLSQVHLKSVLEFNPEHNCDHSQLLCSRSVLLTR